MQETLKAEAFVECLDALEDADAALCGLWAAVAGGEGLVYEVGVQVFKLGTHAQEHLVGEARAVVGGWWEGTQRGDPVRGEEVAEAVEVGAAGRGEAEVCGGEVVGEEGGEADAGSLEAVLELRVGVGYNGPGSV